MHARMIERLLWMFVLAPLFHFVSYDVLVKSAGVAVILLLIRRLRSRRQRPFHMGGYVTQGWEQVAEVYKANLKSGVEQGSAFCIYYKGAPVVDLWGGYADVGALYPRQEDSVGLFYSSTKAVTAVVLAHLADRGLVDYDAKVSSYWPEFGAHDKQDITVRTLVSHQAGLLAIQVSHLLSLCRDDPQAMGELLAEQKPLFKPNTGLGYHTLTFGLYADQIIRRVDKNGRGLSEYFQQEIANKFDIDFYIGQPRHTHHRSCRETRADFGHMHTLCTLLPIGLTYIPLILYSLLKYRAFYLTNLIGNPTDWRPRRLNDPKFREVPCGSSHGFGTARGLAKLMGILGNDGKHEKRTLLSSARIDFLNTPIAQGFDRVVLKELTYGPGLVLREIREPDGERHSVCGHWGAGGQMAYFDPSHKMGWAYNTNFSNIVHGFVMDHRYQALEDAMYYCVRKIESRSQKI